MESVEDFILSSINEFYSRFKIRLVGFNNQLYQVSTALGLQLRMDRYIVLDNITRNVSFQFLVPYYEASFWGFFFLFFYNSWYLIFFSLVFQDVFSFLGLLILLVYYYLFKQGSLPKNLVRFILSIFVLWEGVGAFAFNILFSAFFVLCLIFSSCSPIIPFLLRALILFKSFIFVGGLAYRSSFETCLLYIPSTFKWNALFVDLHPVLDKNDGKDRYVDLDGSVFYYETDPTNGKHGE